ncbi:MAG: hypothetical protein ACK5T6_16020 [Pirellula sp.]
MKHAESQDVITIIANIGIEDNWYRFVWWFDWLVGACPRTSKLIKDGIVIFRW